MTISLEGSREGAPKVFIICSTEEKSQLIASICHRIGLGSSSVFELNPSSDISATIRSGIEDASFCIVALERAASDAVVFEMGMASGLGKPLLVLSEKPFESPISISSLASVQVGWQDHGAITAAIRSFVAALPDISRVRQVVPLLSESNNWAHALVRAREREDSLEELLAAIFASEGADVTYEGNSSFSLAVWHPALSRLGMAPLLVAYKSAKSPFSALRGDMLELAEARERLRQVYSLFVFDGPNAPKELKGVPQVIAWSAEHVVALADEVGIIAALSRFRNEMMHQGQVWRI